MQIVYANESLFESFHQTLDQVAREQIYIEMIEAKPLAEVVTFQNQLVSNNWPGYYAVDNQRVVGWADIFPARNPRLAHRGFLGMGILKEYRNRGIGSELLSASLKHARSIGLEKVELTVYTDNLAAIKLYRKFGFKDVGVIKHYRKLNGRYFDCLEIDLFL